MRILGICGSLQSRSGNQALLESAVASAPEGVEVVLFDGLRDLPPFNPDHEAEPPPSVLAWRRALSESDALLIASPEYGFSLPGVLKNGIDWVIGSAELEQKIVAITAAVKHTDRGRRGLSALRDTLHAVRARIAFDAPIVRDATQDTKVASVVQALVAAAAGRLAPKALVAAWVQTFNRADADALVAFYAPDAINHQVAESPCEGREAIRKMFADGFARATMVCIPEHIFEDGEWAILEWRDPKGLRGCGFFRVVDGLIVFQRGYWDKLSFLRQEGLPLPKD